MYSSPTTGNKCTDSQYLAEFIMLRYAERRGIILPFKFWNTKEWKKQYVIQKIAADALKKAGYDTKSILNALNRHDLQWIDSLNNKLLHDEIEKEQQKILEENRRLAELQVVETVSTTAKPSVKYGKKNALRD